MTLKRTANRTTGPSCILGFVFLVLVVVCAPGAAFAAGGSGGSGSATLRVCEIVHAATVEQTDKVLAYDRADIEAIGTQASTGHSVCCPSFSCAYADAVLDGAVHDHASYGCGCCVWPGWGGGNSSFRNVGTDEQLLREAYDEIAAGRPTVIHVSASYGEHWIALIGYRGATDPDHLTLANFVALDPWDGAQIVASDRFALYGDGCEHVSGPAV